MSSPLSPEGVPEVDANPDELMGERDKTSMPFSSPYFTHTGEGKSLSTLIRNLTLSIVSRHILDQTTALNKRCCSTA